MLFSTPLALIAAAAVVSAAPVVQSPSVPLTHISNVSSLKNIVHRGQARIAAINKASSGFSPQVVSGPATNEDVSYVAAVTIGGKVWQLIVDTGSSNTWCGARTSCEPTSNGRSTGGSVSVTYGSGTFSGSEYTDKVSYAGVSVARQSIGAATSSTGFSTVDGIIGFGPVDLTFLTVSNVYTVPTFMNNLYTQGTIANEVLGVYFKPENGSDINDSNGELTLGGADTAKYTGTLKYFPVITTGAASNYWGISISNFKYGTTTLAGTSSGIVDTGTTLIYIPTAAYNAFLSAAHGTTDSSSGLAIFSTKPTQTFSVTFGSTAYTLTPAQYLVPAAQYANFGLDSSKFYAWINDGGDGSGGGVNCIIGQKFLENYYSVYDTTNNRIGFATRK